MVSHWYYLDVLPNYDAVLLFKYWDPPILPFRLGEVEVLSTTFHH